MEVVIEGNAFYNGQLVRCAIGVEEGRIRSVKKILQGDRRFDFGDKLVLPAAVDAHVHFRDPGMTYKEDFSSGTTAAAYGGVSCVLDMPNTRPQVTDVIALQDKASTVTKKAYVDFGLYAGVTIGGNMKALSRNAAAFKLYLATTTGNMLVTDDAVLPSLFDALSETDLLVSVHCEEETLIDKDLKVDSLMAHLKSRPNVCEALAIRKILDQRKDARVHICHVSTKEGVEMVKGEEVTSEVTPHHLFLTVDSDLGALGKVNPPLRQTEDREALWEALGNGTIDILASDHAPHTLDEKEVFEHAPSGIPGVETMIPMMLSLVKRGRFSLERLVAVSSSRPAELFRLNKGQIQPGRDADIMVVDMRKETEIRAKHLHSRCGWTPYVGMPAVFPRYTFVRGKVVIEDWELTGDRDFGENVKD
jgi:dihydroorotase